MLDAPSRPGNACTVRMVNQHGDEPIKIGQRWFIS
jgi:hypothetical protein